VFDLYMAGPRNRFQAGSLIVSNCGAHTGRWSGYGIQPQNMKRPDEDFDLKGAIEAIERGDRETFEKLCDGQPPYELLGSLVRGIIAPAPGHALVIGDYSQVEARGLLWLCEDWENMQEHLNFDAGTGPDIYCLAAQALYGRKITKKENPLERQTGKISELACGYQGGVGAINRFAYTLNVDLAAAGITDKQIVDGWRAKHPKAVALWRGYNETAIRALEKPGRTYDYGRCEFRFLNGSLEIILPSQRILTYHNARIIGSTRVGWEENKVIAYDMATKGKAITHETYGGKLTENITQALCRDFLADALLRIAAEGYPIPLHVHDEVVAEPLLAQAEECARVMKQIMCTPPDWAPRMPLVAKPDIVLRYGK
jgi:DNA polymerase